MFPIFVMSRCQDTRTLFSGIRCLKTLAIHQSILRNRSEDSTMREIVNGLCIPSFSLQFNRITIWQLREAATTPPIGSLPAMWTMRIIWREITECSDIISRSIWICDTQDLTCRTEWRFSGPISPITPHQHEL